MKREFSPSPGSDTNKHQRQRDSAANGHGRKNEDVDMDMDMDIKIDSKLVELGITSNQHTAKAKAQKRKIVKGGDGDVEKERKGTKTPWSKKEDDYLSNIIEDTLKNHLWPTIKLSKDEKLIKRGSHGCLYHAKMLLRQGKISK